MTDIIQALAKAGIVISTGSEFERRKPDGTLMPLTDETMVRAAYWSQNGTIFVPQQTWKKDFPGQVTAGRIGRPVIRYAPLSWLPADHVARIVGALRMKGE